MPNTRSKQDIEEKWDDLSNFPKTIVKQLVVAEVWDIAPMFQYDLALLCIRLGQSKALRINVGISPMCLITLLSKALRWKFGIFRHFSSSSWLFYV